MKIENVSQEIWEYHCRECPMNNIYQDPRWIKLIQSVYPDLRIHRLICKDANGRVRWLLPLVDIVPLGKCRAISISLPFGNYGGFLVPNFSEYRLNEDDIRPLVDFFDQSRSFAIEIRETSEPIHGMMIDDRYKRFEIVFPETKEILWKKIFTGNARTSVRKAQKQGIIPVFDHPDALSVFQRIYEENASDQGTPIHPIHWYKKLTELFKSETSIVLGKYENQYVGALFMLSQNDRSILHAAVSLPNYRKVAVTDILLWASFERFIEQKTIRRFDFGKTRPVPGKLFFKRKWGGNEHAIYYSYLLKPGQKIPQIQPENPKFDLPIRFWKYIPIPLKRYIGPILRKKIPT